MELKKIENEVRKKKGRVRGPGSGLGWRKLEEFGKLNEFGWMGLLCICLGEGKLWVCSAGRRREEM
jgi:hypothetical protein